MLFASPLKIIYTIKKTSCRKKRKKNINDLYSTCTTYNCCDIHNYQYLNMWKPNKFFCLFVSDLRKSHSEIVNWSCGSLFNDQVKWKEVEIQQRIPSKCNYNQCKKFSMSLKLD